MMVAFHLVLDMTLKGLFIMRLFAQITRKHDGLRNMMVAKGEVNMTLEEVKKFLEENKESEEVKSYLQGLKTVSVEDVKGFLDTDEGKRFIQPELDRYHNKSLNTWKENNLEKLIEDEVAKRNPEQTEEQKRISALEKELEKRDAEAKRERLRNHALGKAQELNLPTNLIDHFLGDDEAQTDELLQGLKETFDGHIKSSVDAKFKENGRDISTAEITKNPIVTESIEEIAAAANLRNK